MIKAEVKIENFTSYSKQRCELGNHVWSVPRLIELSKELEVLEIPLIHLNIFSSYGVINLRQMVEHFKSVNACDLDYPIILDEDGEVMDGRHRLIKALMEDKKTIKAVRFVKNPLPDEIKTD
jgi:hypothetical protein